MREKWKGSKVNMWPAALGITDRGRGYWDAGKRERWKDGWGRPAPMPNYTVTRNEL